MYNIKNNIRKINKIAAQILCTFYIDKNSRILQWAVNVYTVSI